MSLSLTLRTDRQRGTHYCSGLLSEGRTAEQGNHDVDLIEMRRSNANSSKNIVMHTGGICLLSPEVPSDVHLYLS